MAYITPAPSGANKLKSLPNGVGSEAADADADAVGSVQESSVLSHHASVVAASVVPHRERDATAAPASTAEALCRGLVFTGVGSLYSLFPGVVPVCAAG